MKNTEYINITGIGEQKESFLNVKTNEVLVCTCENILSIPHDREDKYGKVTAVDSECPVHGDM